MGGGEAEGRGVGVSGDARHGTAAAVDRSAGRRQKGRSGEVGERGDLRLRRHGSCVGNMP